MWRIFTCLIKKEKKKRILSIHARGRNRASPFDIFHSLARSHRLELARSFAHSLALSLTLLVVPPSDSERRAPAVCTASQFLRVASSASSPLSKITHGRLTSCCHDHRGAPTSLRHRVLRGAENSTRMLARPHTHMYLCIYAHTYPYIYNACSCSSAYVCARASPPISAATCVNRIHRHARSHVRARTIHTHTHTHTSTTFIYPTTSLSADSAFEARSRAGPAEDEIRTSEFI